jgi:hypothetical protein
MLSLNTFSIPIISNGNNKEIKRKSILDKIQNLHELESHVQELIHLYSNWNDEQIRKKKIDSLFSEFKAKKGLLYSSQIEHDYRRQVFEENIFSACKHNLSYAIGRESYYLGITKFSDLTDQEFLNRYTSSTSLVNKQDLNQSPLNSKKAKTQSKYKPYPDKVDFRDRNVISSVEDQKECGACYSFASVGATEAAYSLKTKVTPPPVFSKQEMVDCGEASGFYLKGCRGGVLESAYRYLQTFGVCTAENYPYAGKMGQCLSYKYDRAVKISGYTLLHDVTKDGFLSLLSHQPSSLAIEMRPRFKLYRGGIIDVKGPCGFFFNHAILAVGYSLKPDNGAPAYLILKNSYGLDWGEKGYMYYKLGIGNMGMCAIINSNDSQPII